MIATVGFPGQVTALGTSELVLFTDVAGGCPNAGRGLYTNQTIDYLGNYGFNDAASAYKQTGTWELYDDSNQTGSHFTASAGSDCDLASWNDRISSIQE